ncbi:MAG: hypothetical protein J4F41_03605, partial [Alphaproteobacteria bacterium]|nr:hypothetical protein [Alphaproteobacteria bacterium]
DHADGPWFIPQGFMNGMGGPPAESLRLAMVGAHSSPAFHSTDVVMIDITDRNPLNAGYFALDMGDHLRIRHLEQVTPNGFCVKIAKANQSGYESMLEADILLGRIIFHAQMFPTFPQATP